MAFVLIQNGKAHQIFDAAPTLHPSLEVVETNDPVSPGDVYVNGVFSTPQPTAAELEQTRVAAINAEYQSRLSAELAANGYGPDEILFAILEGVIETDADNRGVGNPLEAANKRQMASNIRALKLAQKAAIANNTPADQVVWPA